MKSTRRQAREADGTRRRRTLKARRCLAQFESLEDRRLLAINLVDIPTWVEQGPGPILNGQSEGLSTNAVAGATQAVAAGGGSRLYLGTVNGGVWRTLDINAAGGPVWTPMTDSQKTLAISSLTVVPGASQDTIYAGTGNVSSSGAFGNKGAGILRSTDSGTTWTALGEVPFAKTKVTAIHVLPGGASAGQRLLVSTSGDAKGLTTGVFLSNNAGATWTRISASGVGLPAGDITSMVRGADVSGSGGVTLATYYATVAGFFDSNGDGVENASDTLRSQKGVFRGEFNPTTGVIGWVEITPMTNVLSDATRLAGSNSKLAVHAHAGVEVLYAGFVAPTDADGKPRLQAFAFSTDRGATWSAMARPFTIEQVDSGVFGVNVPLPFGIHVGGQGDDHFSITAHPTNPNLVYIGGDRQPGGGEGGEPDFGATGNSVGAMDFSGRLFQGDRTLPLLTEWQPITHNFAGGTAPHADSRNMIFVGTAIYEVDDGGVYRYDTAAASPTWASLNSTLRAGEVFRVGYDPISTVIFAGLQDNGASQQRLVDDNGDGSLNDDERRTWELVLGGDATVQLAVTATATDVFRYSMGLDQFDIVRNRYTSGNVLVSSISLNITGLKGGDAKSTERVGQVFVANAVEPGRLIYGLRSLYETKSANFGQTFVEIEPLPDATTAPNRFKGVFAAAYGGRKNGVNQPDVLYFSRGNNIAVRNAGSGFLKGPDHDFTLTAAGFINEIVLDPEDWTRAFATDGDTIYMTDDAGVSWKHLGGSGLVQSINTLEIARSSTEFVLFLGGIGGVFRLILPVGVTATDARGSADLWTRFGRSLPNVDVSDLHLSKGASAASSADDVLLAATFGRGVWSIADPLATAFKPATIELTGDNSGPNLYTIRVSSTDRDIIEVAADSSTFQRFPASDIDRIVIKGSGVSDRLTIDGQFGGPFLRRGIVFDAAGGSDQLRLEPNNNKIYIREGQPPPPAGDGSVTYAVAPFASEVRVDYTSVDVAPQVLLQAASLEVKLVEGLIATANWDAAREAATLADDLGGNIARAVTGFFFDDAPTVLALPKRKGTPSQAEIDRNSRRKAALKGQSRFEAGLPILRRIIETGTGGFSLEDFLADYTNNADLRQKLDDLDATSGNVVLSEENGVTRFDVRVEKVLSGRLDLQGSALAGLVSFNGAIDLSARVRMHLVFGVDAAGFFVETDASVEPELIIDQLSGQGDGEGRLGFLGVFLTGATLSSSPQARLEIDLRDPGTQAVDGMLRIAEIVNGTVPNGAVGVEIVGGAFGDGLADLTLEAGIEVDGFRFDPLQGLRLRFAWDTLERESVPTGSSNLSITPVVPAAQKLLDFLNGSSGQILSAINGLSSTLDEAIGLDLMSVRVPVLNKTLGELVGGPARPIAIPSATMIDSVGALQVEGDKKTFVVILRSETPTTPGGAPGSPISITRLGVVPGQVVRYKTAGGQVAQGTVKSTSAGQFIVQFDGALDQTPAADPQIEVTPTQGALGNPVQSLIGSLSIGLPTLQDLVAELSAAVGIDLFTSVSLIDGPGGFEIRITLPFDPDPLVFDTSFGLGESIPGLAFDASGKFTVTVDPSFRITLGLRLGPDLALADRVYLVADDEPEARLVIDVALDNLSLNGSVGFLDVHVGETGNPATNPGIAIQANVSLNLIDPVPDGGGRITLADIAAHPLGIFDAKLGGSFTFGGLALTAALPVADLGAFTLTIGLDGGPTFPINSLADLSALPGKIKVSGQLDNFSGFRNITPGQILDLLDALIDQLTALGTGGIFQKPIPLVNKSFADLVNLGQSLSAKLGNPAGSDTPFFATARALENFLNDKIDSDPATDFVDVIATPGDIRFVFRYQTPQFTRSAPISFELGGGRAFSPQLAGQGELVLNAFATVTLALGVKTAAGLSLGDRVFLVGDNAPVPASQKTGFLIEGHANAGLGAGQAFSFTATLGPVQLGVVNGRARIDAALTAGVTDASRPNPDGLLTLAEIAQAITANQGASLLTGGFSADVQAVLPIDGFDPDALAPPLATGPLGTDAHVEVVGRLTGVANATIAFLPEGPAVFTTVGQPLPGASLPQGVVQVTTHNLDGLIAGAFLNLGSLIDGLEQFIDWGKQLLGIDTLRFKLPLVGKALTEVFDFFGGQNADGASVRKFIDDLKAQGPGAFGPNASAAALNQAVNLLRNALRSVPGILPIADLDGDGLELPSVNGDDLVRVTQVNGLVTGVEVLVKFAPSVSVPLSGGLDLGTSFLNVSADVALTLTGSLQFLLGFGVDKDRGFYLKTDFTDLGLAASEKEIKFHGDLKIGGVIDAKLGFLKLGGAFDPTKNFLAVDFNIDINGGTDPAAPAAANRVLTFAEMLDFGSLRQRFTAQLPVAAKVDVDLAASVSSSLPSLGAKLNVDWNFDAIAGNIPAPNVELSDIRVDLGSFLDRVLRPVWSRLQSLNIVPQQLLDLLNQPLPILNETLFDLLIRPLDANQQKVARFLFNIAAVIAETNQNAGMATGLMLRFDTRVPIKPDPNNALGSSNTATAEVDPAAENGTVNGQAVPPPNPAAPGTGLPVIGGFLESLAEIGVTFPALKLSNLVKLFIGGDLDIVLVNPPRLKIDLEFNREIPLFSAGIPYVADVYISAFFGGGLHFQANVSAGFDTSGLKRGSFLGGIYLGDFDPIDGVIDPGDPERPELSLTADIHAGIEAGVRLVGLPIGRATGTARLTASINVDLNDDNATSDGRLPDGRPYADHFDGKLHFYEIPTIVASNMGNPFCLFDLSGSLDASLELRLFVALVFDKTISQQFHLLDFNLQCEPTTVRETPVSDEDDVDAPFQTVDLADLLDNRTRLSFTQSSSDQLNAAAGTNAPAGDRVEVILEDLNGDPTDGVDVVTIASADVTVAQATDGSFLIGDAKGAQFLVNGVLSGMAVLYTNVSGVAEFGTILAVANDVLTVRPIATNGKGPMTGAAVTVKSGKETLKVLKGAWFERFGPLELINNNPAISPNFVSDIRTIVSIDGSRGFLAGDDRVTIDPLIRASVTLNGGDGNDSLVGGSGRNTLIGGSGDDLLQIAFAPINLNAAQRQARASRLEGSAGNDTLIGGVGDDTLLGGTGDDSLDGFGGIVAATDLAALKTTYGLGGRDSIVGNGGDDVINGRDDDDTLVGDNEGGSGFEGRDLIVGGEGNDLIWGDNRGVSSSADGIAPDPSRSTGDTLIGGLGTDVIFAGAGADFVDGDADPNAADLGTAGADTVFGGSGNDTILGRGGNDSLVGEAGDDLIDGGDGNDLLFGGDIVIGPTLPAQTVGTLGRDTILGGSGNDLIEGADSITLTAIGGSGNDTILGSRGQDRLEGGDGRDFLVGGPGADLINGGPGDDDIVGGRGSAGGVNYPTFAGGRDGADRIEASLGADVVIPGAGTINPTTRTTTLAATTADLRSLDLSAYPAGVTIDLDQSGTQTFPGVPSLRLASAVESFLGTPFNDQVTARPHALARTLLQGGGGAADALTIDALGATVLLTPGSVIFTATPSGTGALAPVSFSGFATVRIINAAATLTVVADARANLATLRLLGNELTYTLQDGPVITATGVTSTIFRALNGDDAVTIDFSAGVFTFDGGNGFDTLTLPKALTAATLSAADAPTLLGGVTTDRAAGPTRLLGRIDLGSSDHSFDVPDGPAAVDLALEAVLTGSSVQRKTGAGLLAASGNSPGFTGRWRVVEGVLRVDGDQGQAAATVEGGTLSGKGKLGSVEVLDGILDPGGIGDVGVLTIEGTLAFTSRAIFRALLKGTVPGTGFDRVVATRGVDLGGAQLDATLAFNSAVGNTFTVVSNTSPEATRGTFAGLAEGATFTLDGVLLQVSYRGGDGNDVVLSRINTPPKFPDRAISQVVAEGGLAVLTGRISEPDTLDSFALSVDWGDGSAEVFDFPPEAPRDVRLTHRYLDDSLTDGGQATVRMVWSDPNGGSNAGNLVVTVVNQAPELGNLTAPGVPEEFRQAEFQLAVADPGADPLILTIDWGDGTPFERVELSAGVGSAALSHRFPAGGEYRVQVTADDGDGGVSQTTGTFRVAYANARREAIAGQYLHHLGRYPTASEVAFWAWRIGRGVPPVTLARALAGSLEGRSRVVRSAYRTYLRREPADWEVGFWLRSRIQGSAEALRAAFLASDEYYQAQGGGTASGFLDAAFRDALGRSPGQAERFGYVAALDAGVARASVLRRILWVPRFARR